METVGGLAVILLQAPLDGIPKGRVGRRNALLSNRGQLMK